MSTDMSLTVLHYPVIYPLDEQDIINTFKYVSAPMGRFQLELIYLYFPPSFHLTVVSVITTFSTGLVGVENVVITTKGLQDRTIHILDGTTVENKGKTIN